MLSNNMHISTCWEKNMKLNIKKMEVTNLHKLNVVVNTKVSALKLSIGLRWTVSSRQARQIAIESVVERQVLKDILLPLTRRQSAYYCHCSLHLSIWSWLWIQEMTDGILTLLTDDSKGNMIQNYFILLTYTWPFDMPILSGSSSWLYDWLAA